MKFEKVRPVARFHSINPGKLSRTWLMKSIPTNQRNFDCSAPACGSVCDQAGCSWHDDCTLRKTIINLVKWDPLKELEAVSNRLNHIFGQPLARTEPNHERLAMADWTPSTDVSETDTAYLIKAEIPGVNKEDVKVTLQDGMLTIQGERRQEKEENDKKFHRIERSYGSFVRSFRIPEDADESTVKAEFKDGMLNITLTKSANAKSRVIEVLVS